MELNEALAIAVQRSGEYHNISKRLIGNRADVNADVKVGKTHSTCLDIAVTHSGNRMASCLRHHGADPNFDFADRDNWDVFEMFLKLLLFDYC